MRRMTPQRKSATDATASDVKSQPTRVILVRHGETDWNVVHRLQGITDTKLTETGVLQAERTAVRLAKMGSIARFYSSDLSRAIHTAQAIAKACSGGLDAIVLDKRLREFDLGIFAGHTQVEARQKFPEQWHEYTVNDSYVVPEGESYEYFIQRTTSALEEIRKAHEGETICVVTHGGVIDCIKNFLVLHDDGIVHTGRCGNASLSEFVVGEDGKWRIKKWNDVSHLASLHKKVLEADDVIEHEDPNHSDHT